MLFVIFFCYCGVLDLVGMEREVIDGVRSVFEGRDENFVFYEFM